jgi:hypothetical protein
MKLYRMFRHKKYGEPLEIEEDINEVEEDEEEEETKERSLTVKGRSKLKKKKKVNDNEDLHTIIEEESLNEVELS